MSTFKLIWSGSYADLQTLDTLLSEVLWPAADAVTLLKDDSTKEEIAADWSLHAYFTDLPEQGALQAMVQEAGLALAPPTQEALPDKDWVAHALEGLGVVEAGPFLLYGSHDAAKVEGREGHLIQVEANQAFGTGHHPTTAGCLHALADLATIQPGTILDLGTGSGILAMAARRLWPTATIMATDIDGPSVAIATENAHTNGIDDITFAVADGVNGEAASAGPYALILANILAAPLKAFAPDIASHLRPGGHLVLAGLLDHQREDVEAAYAAQGLQVIDRRDQNTTWPVLTLRFNAD